MKKIKFLITILNAALILTSCASKPKADSKADGKVNNVILDPANKFAIEGVELGTVDWARAILNDKGEIWWDFGILGDCYEIGWDLRGVDLSAYGGIRIKQADGQNQPMKLLLADSPMSMDCWAYEFDKNGEVFAPFNGAGNIWGAKDIPVLEEGFEIKIQVPSAQFRRTFIKSVELIKKENIPDTSDLILLGRVFGSQAWQTTSYGNEIIWTKGYTSGDFGWNLSGIDLSEYDRIRIEVESNNATNLGLRICDSNHNNWHGFDQQIEPNVWEADLTGEGASWLGENATTLDKSQGLQIFFQTWDKPENKEYKTVIKSVQLLKGKKIINENLKIFGKAFGSTIGDAYIYDDGIIEWKYNPQNIHPWIGWNVKGVDFGDYDKIRIELESSDVRVQLRLVQDDCLVHLEAIRPNILEIKLDGSDGLYPWPEGSVWDVTKETTQIQIMALGEGNYNGISKNGLKTKIKSVTLLKASDEVQQPDNLILNGVKLGSRRDNAWLDDDFAINWNKVGSNYANCGWKVQNLEGEFLEIKVSSTDVPLRLRIRDIENDNDASWLDDGTHIFRIMLESKLQQHGEIFTDPEWEKSDMKFDLSNTFEIVFEPLKGVFKEGKKTVVEHIKVE